MKPSIPFLLFCLFTISASAEFRTWTRNDGKTAELELVAVTESGGVKSGEFKMRNGKSVTLAASVLAEADAKALAEWKPTGSATEPVAAAVPSVFDEVLDGNLEILDGRRLKRHADAAKPTKHYVFYYTASWCGPCQAYTPDLVKFYEKNKNDSFELVLITSDREEDAMVDYAKDKKMSWPHLKFSKAKDFMGKFKHNVTGIPSVIVCDLQGTIVSRSKDFNELAKILK